MAQSNYPPNNEHNLVDKYFKIAIKRDYEVNKPI